ncbi:hypothetical protein JTB14_037406 [Gonioctena quinquepunctata]|nr:hypothetical protein JTB14_037406 [Gonioctena quinquepunctata]
MVNTRSSGTNEFDPVKDIVTLEIIKKLLSDELEKQTSKLVEKMLEFKNQIQVLKQTDTVVDIEHRGPPLPKNGKHDEWNTTSYKKPKRKEEAHTKQSRTQGQQFKVSQSSLSKKESDKIIRDIGTDIQNCSKRKRKLQHSARYYITDATGEVSEKMTLTLNDAECTKKPELKTDTFEELVTQNTVA